MIMFQGYKDYDKNLNCRNHQREIGKLYEIDKQAKLYESRFQFYHYPLDVLGYYVPSNRRCTTATSEDTNEERQNDTKACAKKLTVGAEIGIPGIMKVRVEYSRERINK